MRLFTIDIETKDLKVIYDKYAGWSKKDKREALNTEKRAIYRRFKATQDSQRIFKGDPEFKELRRHHSAELDQLFRYGFSKYLAGEWPEANKTMDKCLSIDRRDGPSMALKEYIESENAVAPLNWDGFRILTEK